jgi:hypothetical protein
VDIRRGARARCTSCWPLRQVSIMKAVVKAIRSGNQPPSKSLVVLAARNTRSTTSRAPFSTYTRTGLWRQCRATKVARTVVITMSSDTAKP